MVSFKCANKSGTHNAFFLSSSGCKRYKLFIENRHQNWSVSIWCCLHLVLAHIEDRHKGKERSLQLLNGSIEIGKEQESIKEDRIGQMKEKAPHPRLVETKWGGRARTPRARHCPYSQAVSSWGNALYLN